MLASFLNTLLEDGHVSVSPELEAAQTDEVVRKLEELDGAMRINLAVQAPPFSLPAAFWGATILYRGCQFLVCRDATEAEVKNELAYPCPEPHSPAVDYSVDLTFRFLPDLASLARRTSPNDPLLKGLVALAREWPLSSVGVDGIGEVTVDSFIEDRCLLQLYVDRILARNDLSRARDPRVELAIKETLGAHSELCPAAPHL